MIAAAVAATCLLGVAADSTEAGGKHSVVALSGTRQLFMAEADIAAAVNVAHTTHSPSKKGTGIHPNVRATPYLGPDSTI